MIKSKKLNMILLCFMLALTSFLFMACTNKDYNKISLTSSSELVELFVDEEKEITVKINNPVDEMDPLIVCDGGSNPSACVVEEVSMENFITTFKLIGKKGGNSTIKFSTKEGGKTATVEVNVKQYSTSLKENTNSLYVSNSTQLTPNSIDFVFSESTTERNLNFYFYGKNVANSTLESEDVKQNGEFIKEFVSAKQVSIGDDIYLIFTDEHGLLHTLGKSVVEAGTNNIIYSFIDVIKTDEGYDFDTSLASSVFAGDEFTFVAVYPYETETELVCSRTFNVLKDIQKDDLSYEYGYKLVNIDYQIGNDLSLYKVEGKESGTVTLIPSYVSVVAGGQLVGERVSYVTAYLEVSFASVSKNLLLDVDTEDDNVVNASILNVVETESGVKYYIQLNSATGDKKSTNLVLKFYYEGFENSNDDNVCYNYLIPVETRIIPTKTLVNNTNLNEKEQVFTFYNSYAGDSFGWQEFDFSLIPQNAEYDYLEVDLTGSPLRLRYKNISYYDTVVKINDLSEPVYIKGLENSEANELVKKLPISLKFNIIQDENIDIDFSYKIAKGASVLNFKTDDFDQNGIYVDLLENDYLTFNDLYADAEFGGMSVKFESGVDCVNFKIDNNNLFTLQGKDYLLNLSVNAKKIGTGVYTVSLDNGKQKTITVNCIETLKNIKIETTNAYNNIKFTRFDEGGVDEGGKTLNPSVLYYVLNKNKNEYVDISVLANNNQNSTAISNVVLTFTSNNIELGGATNGNKNFNIYPLDQGKGQLNVVANGFMIENFVCKQTSLSYDINAYIFDYIDEIEVFKTSDAQGTYSEHTK